MGDEIPDEEQSATSEEAMAESAPLHAHAPDSEPAPDAPADSDASEPDAEERRALSRQRRQERAEAARRKRERQLLTRLWIGGAIVLVIFLASFWPVMAGRLGGAKQLDDAAGLLTQAENTVGQIDKLVQRQLSAEAGPNVRDIKPDVAVARRELTQARQLVADAMPHLTEDEQSRAKLVQSAVAARLIQLDRAPAILSASTKAVRAKSVADRGWDLMLRGEAAEQTAAKEYRANKASAVESAAVSVATIRAEFSDAQTFYSQAATAFPQAGIERYATYVGGKTPQLDALEAAARAWLRHDLASAAREFSAYQKASARTAVQRKQLPGAPGVATGQGFRQLAGSAADAYERARTEAQKADKALATP